MKYNKELRIPIILVLLFYALAYYLPIIFIPLSKANYLPIWLDDYIPLFSPFVVIYLLAFIQWIYSLLVLYKLDSKKGYYICSSIIIATMIASFIYFIYPTAVHRPNIEVNNIFDWILSKIYFMDKGLNALPSLHCFCSYMVVVILRQQSKINKKIYVLNIIFSILVFMSTVLTKQHYVIDIPFGILLAIVSTRIAKKINFEKLFIKLNNHFNQSSS